MVDKKLFIFAGLIVFVLICNYIFGWSEYLGDMDNLMELQQQMEHHKFMLVGIYIILTIIGCVVLALPGVTFAIVAGLLFGPIIGTLACSLATTIGAVLAFWVGRFFLQDSIKPMAMKNKYLKKWLFSDSGNNQLFILMLTRLIPVFPYNLQNFAYGVTNIKLSTYVIGSFVFMLPGTAMYTVGTAGIANEENRVLYIATAVVLAVVVLGVTAFLKKRYIKEEDGHEA